MNSRKYNNGPKNTMYVISFIFSIFFCITVIFQIHPSDVCLPYLCSDTCKDIRKSQIYPQLLQNDFLYLTQVNRYLHNEIGTVNYIDFKKLKKHFKDASLSGYNYNLNIWTRKTIHLCCLPKPYSNTLKKEMYHFIETEIIPTFWSNKSCFLHKVRNVHHQCSYYKYWIDPSCGNNYIKLISGNGAASDEITTISLENDSNKRAFLSLSSKNNLLLCDSCPDIHTADQNDYPQDYSHKYYYAMILYIIDDLDQSLESLDHYVNNPEEHAPFMIILSNDLQNNEQMRQKIRDKIDKRFVNTEYGYKTAYYCNRSSGKKEPKTKLYSNCRSCEKDPSVKWLYPDPELVPNFSFLIEEKADRSEEDKLIAEREKKEKLKKINEKRKKNAYLEEKRKAKEASQVISVINEQNNHIDDKKLSDVPVIESKSIESADEHIPKSQKITHALFEPLKNNRNIIAISFLGLSSIIGIWLIFKYHTLYEIFDHQST